MSDEEQRAAVEAIKATAARYFAAYTRLLQLTGSSEEAKMLTESLFTALFRGNKQDPPPGSGGFTLYWDRRR